MTKRIMIIDDEDMFREPLKAILSKKGFIVNDFPEGNSALEWWKDGNEFDLLLLDLNNPLGMDGFQVLKEIPSLNYQGDIFLISGDSSPEIDKLVEENRQIKKVYIKPFPITDMINAIEEINLYDEPLAA